MNKKLIIIIAVVLVLVLGIGAAVFIFLFNGDKEEEPVEVKYFEFTLDTQYANIKKEDEDARGLVLKYSPVIQYTSEEALETLTANKTTILTEMRKYFMNRTKGQLDRLERVQEDLTDIVIETTELDPETISNVLFLEFITQ